MKAAVLQDVEKLVVQQVPDPVLAPNEVMLRVKAVGVCGTDLHIYRGHGNYNLDAKGRRIPLSEQPQILGHEFSGEIVEVGKDVTGLKAGDRVLCDQGINCVSRGRQPLCPYCATGDSHQCETYGEHGITGLQGALADYIAMPVPNCLALPPDMPMDLAALVEPVGCVLHASERTAQATARYTLDGNERVKNILICGAGPAGIYFLQYLRNVMHFEGLILVSDLREINLDLVGKFGGTPVNVTQQDLHEAVQELTHGEKIHYLIEACGDSIIFEQMPSLIRKQATVLLYGHGHHGRDISLLGNILFLEPVFVVPVGASGGFDPDGRPTTYRRARELVNSRTIQVSPLVTHRYRSLEDAPRAFAQDFQREDYIKGILALE
ncbi:MAG TPA: alcohol dehydrogenase catalytic domain-containing protein [Terriglobia bacterium]|nr:alcohol dehydrogenase catalytic domain-containing protein [Terriglobia bacterium]